MAGAVRGGGGGGGGGGAVQPRCRPSLASRTPVQLTAKHKQIRDVRAETNQLLPELFGKVFQPCDSGLGDEGGRQ